jgi:hypothetical protein
MVLSVLVAGQSPVPGRDVAVSALRTSWGDPDIQGTWTSDNMINVPFERPAQFGERRFLTAEEFTARVQENEKWIADANAERPVIAFAKDTPNYQIYEYACHEGNYGLANMLSAARAEEKAGH